MNVRRERIPDEIAAEVDRIYARAKSEVLMLFQASPPAVILETREWMSAIQLAEYWQLYNDKAEPSIAGILKWAKRSKDQFPLPHAYMGDLLRFNRQEVDQWARGEAERRRSQSEKRRLKIA